MHLDAQDLKRLDDDDILRLAKWSIDIDGHILPPELIEEALDPVEGREGPEMPSEPPSPALAPESAKPQSIARGRPARGFWDDLIIETAYEIHMGSLKPRSIADIVGFMQDWLISNGHDAGDTTLKERARKIWIRFIDG
ncbi:hypothetical protein [Sphingomicrobium astaxanthinifaciens]|uniref:hypothetical protein n=1 Tax=Sphingomicrobium astaxanthinifaciens TaxID=1227949 RepID=UPI001FCAE692|nr:hypothetical protein [Sphingomicrobium astaxanthinifaciens]MCJ7420944.1 hypothetical protein [Sphingomicrobium astaxanthinifaciens]